MAVTDNITERIGHGLIRFTMCLFVNYFAEPAFAADSGPEGGLPNVLFIAVDDLRSQLGCYGHDDMVTPNIDALAERGIVFRNHFVANPVCIPSRAALLTSLRSERTRQLYGPALWPRVEGVQTLGRTFGDAGYYTASLGKIWHTQGPVEKGKADRFDFVWRSPGNSQFADPELSRLQRSVKRSDREALLAMKARLPAAEGPLDVADTAYGDGQLADMAVKTIRDAAADDRPFLIMVGFQKPHLPFNAPKKYWDLYDPADPPGTPMLETLPESASPLEVRTKHELWKTADGFSQENPPVGVAASRLRQAYAACVSFVDAQVGKVIAALDGTGVAENTVIVFWSDHGYQLGHLASWTKSTNFEMTAGSPLIISAPGYGRGVGADGVVGSVDLFPTLLDLCGLQPLPVSDGVSLRPILEDPEGVAWDRPSYHLVRRGRAIGRAVRDSRFRYVEWRDGWERDSRLLDVELYDYEEFPEERVNVAESPRYRSERERLADLLWEY
ncbi:MAG: sulfatase [Planctomycetota bacterium]